MTPSSDAANARLHILLEHCFDASYLRLLELSKVSLDDELQRRTRSVIVPEVWGVLSAEYERTGNRTHSQKERYFQEHAQAEIERRLTQELCIPDLTAAGLPIADTPETGLLPSWETLQA